MSKSFGVGCFHFEIEGVPEDKVIKPKDYTDRVKDHLSRYSNIEEVSIEPYRRSAGLEFMSEPDDDGDIAFGVGVRPCPIDWAYCFRLNIPLRLQREMLGDDRCLESEQIDVALHYTGDLPVAIIQGHDAYFSSPSTAVVLVRRYLEEYSPENTGVQFRYLGPSPFHADFYVKFEGPDSTFDVKITEQQGYDDVDFVSGADINAVEAISYAHEIAAKELRVYYSLIQARNRLMKEWAELSQGIDDLVDQAQKRSGWPAFKYGPWWRAKLDRASLELVRFKLRADEAVTGANASLDKLSRKENLDNLRKYADAEVAGIREYAIQDFSQMLSLLERRSHAAAANLTVLVAALLGGIIGAVLTAYFGPGPK